MLCQFFLLAIHFLAFASTPHFYPQSYQESRAHLGQWVEKNREKFPEIQYLALPVATETGADLTIDTLHLPQGGAKKQNLLIITSGTHGVEAFTGSAIQFAFLETLDPTILQSMGILIVHAVNPYGYHFHRRVTENNVDMNRNFSGNDRLFDSFSSSYANFDSFLNPKDALNASWWNDVLLFGGSIAKLIYFGKKELTQIVVGGQYQEPKGIYFGGDAEEINGLILKNEFVRIGDGYDRILHIDLHTGFGERGKLHFFTNKKATELKGFSEMFAGFPLDLGEDKDFYHVSGSFEEFTVRTFPQKLVIPMTFEFGTMDSQTIWGGFLSLKNMIYENQGFHHGYENDASKEKVAKDFMEMFNPSESSWRENAIQDGLTSLKTLIERFSKDNGS